MPRRPFGWRGVFVCGSGSRVSHGVITKTYSVTDLRKSAAHRYSPAAVVAVSREAVIGDPEEISTSYVERSNFSLRMASRRFTRLTNGFSKKLDNHAAAVSLYVAHYNLCRYHETIRATPAEPLGWSITPGRLASFWTLPWRSPRRTRLRLRRIGGVSSG
jgi:hypothetical protein